MKVGSKSVAAYVYLVMACGQSHAAPATESHASAQVPTGPGSLAGVWTPADFDRSVFRPADKTSLRTIEGGPPPLQPAMLKLIEKRKQDAREGHPYAGLQSKCLPSGMPQMMFGSGLPKQTLETPDQVTMLSEELTFFRVIRLNAPHEAHPEPSFMGDSVGHWEGGDLIVDTIGISDRTLLPDGIPHSGQLHIVERYRRTSKDRIEILMTFDDPIAFTRPWTTVTHLYMEPTRRLTEYYCENNRNVAVGEASTAVLPGSSP